MSETTTLDQYLTEQVLGHESQALTRVRRPTWVIHKEAKVEGNWAGFLQENMAVAMEVELNANENATACPKRWMECIDHERNMIYQIHKDCTVRGFSWEEKTSRGLPQNNGNEFILKAIQGLRSEEFATRLPLKAWRDHFSLGSNTSIHTHSIVLPYGQHKPVPIQIAQNAWQLFRLYYPGWVYLFGNHKGRMLRSCWAVWKKPKYENISHNPAYTYSAYVPDGNNWTWKAEVATDDKREFGGLSFEDSIRAIKWQKSAIGDKSPTPLPDLIGLFDAEIRVSDSTFELDQFVAMRALAKALFIRAADLANVGVIDLPQHREREAMEIANDIANSVTGHYDCNGGKFSHGSFDDELEARRGRAMGRIATAFYNEMRPYLTPFEKRNVKSCLIRPVRHRGIVFDN